mgnify:CR=1 FL=1
MDDARNKDTGTVPMHLRNAPASGMKNLGYSIGYKYPHDYAHHWVKQQYLPDDIKNHKYYKPGDNKFEQANKEYWEKIKK